MIINNSGLDSGISLASAPVLHLVEIYRNHYSWHMIDADE